MSASIKRALIPFTEFDLLREGRSIVRQEAQALEQLAQRLDTSFVAAIDLLLSCQGSVIVTGMGKAGIVGQKITATLSSVGIRSHFLHPAEAVHGDLGCLHTGDLLLAFSNSGETEELIQILPVIRRLGIPIIAVTSSEQNALASQASVTITIGRLPEACPWGLAPTTSTTAMLAVGDALALVTSQRQGFSPQQFAELHPAGSLGQKLKPVTDVMRPHNLLRIAPTEATVREVFVRHSGSGRRSGVVLIVDESGVLSGLFTDSDLARLLQRAEDGGFDLPISSVMTENPLTIRNDATLADAIDLLSDRKLSEIPVVDHDHRLLGLIDITDVIGWTPAETSS